eukprot:CAMPEP_0206425444 /NCGR_PEP_ID=MMETSP0324_2-20121206/3795_1 /ASSEMBLY_ACC=CAM_ASM_000836 /TAXON_ID=2866 /ORGANISM="Crypthecodinium cohnii, Strain Seligo" /LENGTH=510 /DNA_ID=CAMNT_0053890227 /DNA_START=72 /DNA_END=1604 /DNA_ORIENTATION=-
MTASFIDQWSTTLSSLPPHSHVAVLILQGSLCPITLAHTQCFEVARQVLLRESGSELPPHTETFAEVFGVIALNGEGYVRRKMEEAGCENINMYNRRHLVNLAIQGMPWMGFAERSDRYWSDLSIRWPHLNFIFYYLNGADDVVKYRKWKDACHSYRLFTVGRPGSTSQIGRPAGGENPYFIVGPELPDISSTMVRQLLGKGDKENLVGLLHPDVATWCIENKVFQGRASTGWSTWTDWGSTQRWKKRWTAEDKATHREPENHAAGEVAPPPYVGKFKGVLSDLPTGSFVAILRMRGSLCPVTVAHTQCFALAREVLLRQRKVDLPENFEDFKAVLGLVACNGDGYVSEKMKGAGWSTLGLQTRSKLIALATEDIPWLAFDDRTHDAIREVREHFPLLNFIHFDLNGADDVLKYRKWELACCSTRLFVMGRPGHSHELGEAQASRWTIVGPEVEDISSTQVGELIVSLREQEASEEDAIIKLSQYLQPKVARYCIEKELVRRLPSLCASG